MSPRVCKFSMEPYQIQFIKALEKVQMNATKLMSNLLNKSH